MKKIALIAMTIGAILTLNFSAIAAETKSAPVVASKVQAVKVKPAVKAHKVSPKKVVRTKHVAKPVVNNKHYCKVKKGCFWSKDKK
jgi:hypothetical protein